MKDKHRELRAAIAAIRRNNRALLAVLPQWRCESGDETAKDNVTAFSASGERRRWRMSRRFGKAVELLAKLGLEVEWKAAS